MSGIVHVTTVHKRNDIRIFQKELRSLAREFGNISLVVNDGFGDSTAEGIRIIDLNIRSRSRLGRFVKPFFRLVKLVRGMKPDIVHFHDPELIPFGLVMSVLGYTLVYDAHEDVPEDILGKPWIPMILRRITAFVFSRFERFSVRFFKAVIFVIESQLPRLGFKKNIVLHNFPILSDYTDDTVEPAEKYFIHIGTLTEVRGLNEILDALLLLPEDYSLLVAGIFSPSAFETAQQHPAWSRVRYIEWVERKKLIPLTKKAIGGLLLFHPLPNMYNSSPNKLFEYMASGIPVICSDFPGFREVVAKNECGILVDPLDSKAIAEAMGALLRDEAGRARMGTNGLRAVRALYSWESESRKLIGLYSDILSGKG